MFSTERPEDLSRQFPVAHEIFEQVNLEDPVWTIERLLTCGELRAGAAESKRKSNSESMAEDVCFH